MRIEEIYNHKHKLSGTPLPVRNLFILPAFFLTLFSGSFLFNISTALLVLILTLYYTCVNFKKVLKLYTYPILFIVLGCLTIAFKFNSSSPFFPGSNWDFGFDMDSVKQALNILSRSIAIVCIVCFGLLTHTISEISTALRFLRIPGLFVEIFILTYKFIFNLSSTSRVMHKAQLSRQGYMSKKNNIKAFTLLSSAIFRRAIQQSNHLAIAIDVRLGSGNIHFISKKNNFNAKQLFAPLLLMFSLLVSFIILNTHG